MNAFAPGPSGLLVPAHLAPRPVTTGAPPGVFLDLALDGQVERVAQAIVRAVEASYTARPMASRTRQEDKDRAARCLRLVGVMRGDLHMAVARVCDALAGALVDDIDGIDFAPPRRACWAPGDE